MSKPKRINSLSEVQKFLQPERWKTSCTLVDHGYRVRIVVTYTAEERTYYRSEVLSLPQLKAMSNSAISVYAAQMQDKLLHDLFHGGVLRHGEL